MLFTRCVMRGCCGRGSRRSDGVQMTTAISDNTQARLMKTAGEFVNQAFYGTLMREVRNAQEPTLFDRGPGGMTFIRQLDQELVNRIGRRGEPGLVDAVVRYLSRPEKAGERVPSVGPAAADVAAVYSRDRMNG